MATEGTEIDLSTIPEDPAEALKLLAALESGEAAPAPAPAAPAAAPATPAPAPAASAPAASEPSNATQAAAGASDPEPEGVFAKDGKNVIPYSVLRSEREQRTAAQNALSAANAQVDALKAQLAASAPGANTGAPARAAEQAPVAAPEATMSDADLEALREDFPTVYKALKASQEQARVLQDQIRQQSDQLREQANFRRDIESATQRETQDTVQDVIDANPKLAHIQANDATAFQLAQRFDDTLKSMPGWAHKPMAERFAKVIEMVEQANGAIALPGGKSGNQLQPTAAELEAAARAAAAAATAKPAAASVPTSLSEFPVGQPPAQSEQGALESMSHFQVAAKLGSMTPEQMEAYFASL